MAGGVKDDGLLAAMFLPQLLLHCGVAGKGGLEERLGVRVLLGAKVGNGDISWKMADKRSSVWKKVSCNMTFCFSENQRKKLYYAFP